MTSSLVELPLRQYLRVQGLPHDFPHVARESVMESTDQNVTNDSHVEGTALVEVREEFTTYDNPLVEQPPRTDTTFNFPTEGQPGASYWVINHSSNDTIGVELGPNDPF